MRRPSSCFDLTGRVLLTHILLLHHFGEAEPAQAFARTDRQSGEATRQRPTRCIYLCSLTLRTTPGRGSAPKWLEPGGAKVSVILENSTSLPPVISITKGDGETGAGLSIERNHGRTGYSKSVCNPRDIAIDESDMVSMGAPGVRIKIAHVFRQDPTVRQFHVQGRGKIRLA